MFNKSFTSLIFFHVLNWPQTISSVARVEGKSVRPFGINEMIQSSSSPSPAQQQQQLYNNNNNQCVTVSVVVDRCCWCPLDVEKKVLKNLNWTHLTKKCYLHKFFNSRVNNVSKFVKRNHRTFITWRFRRSHLK